MNSTIKPKPCPECGSKFHSAMWHKPRKPIETSVIEKKPEPCEWCGYRTHLSFQCWKNPKRDKGNIADKPAMHCTTCDGMGHSRNDCPYRQATTKEERSKTKSRYDVHWNYTRKLWRVQNPPSHEGFWNCHYCGLGVKDSDMTLDHKIPRSRAPELRFILTNLTPSCWTCNTKKGSIEHDKYPHTCNDRIKA